MNTTSLKTSRSCEGGEAQIQPFDETSTLPILDVDQSTVCHVQMMHDIAEGNTGVLVVVGYGEDPVTGKKLSPVIGQFGVGDVNHALEFVAKYINTEHLNLYMAPVVYRHGLSGASRGKKQDIVVVLGLVADFDDNDAANYMNRMPVPPDYVLETSKGRYQAFYLLDKPATPEEAEKVAKSLKAYCKCDHGTADINHVWRIPGTRNWPNKKKVGGGRSKTPQLVRVVK